ncbi:MAG: T9SS type A sorting domain-containing protein, partial [Spirochaetaceae bacterium]|nr:T9SS type A sorting domain-containing protein [Spirochaetaceae bacterium]
DGPNNKTIKIPLLGTYPPEIEWREIRHVTCNGYNDGFCRIAPTLGQPPYSIKWMDNSQQTDSTFTGMVAGKDYWVEVTDNRGWQVRDTILLTEPDAMVTSAVYSDLICLNSSDGFISLTTTGGTTPYKYLWSNGTSQASLNDLVVGTYSVNISDGNGCGSSEEYIIHHVVPFGEEEICVVTNDLVGENNLVVWESTPGKGIAYYNVYREAELMGTVPYGESGVFEDTVANAGSRPYLYYITVTDTCGNESPKSPYHKPLFLQHVSSVNEVNLQWDAYEAEGKEIDFESYTIFRGSDSLNLSPLAQDIPSVVNVYTDSDPEVLTRKYYYRVAGVLMDSCNTHVSFKGTAGSYHYFFSNMVDNKIDDNTGNFMQQVEDQVLHIYPNPFDGETTIDFPNENYSEYSLIVLDMTGRIVFLKEGIRENQITLKSNLFKPGVYHVELRGPCMFRGTMIVKQVNARNGLINNGRPFEGIVLIHDQRWEHPYLSEHYFTSNVEKASIPDVRSLTDTFHIPVKSLRAGMISIRYSPSSVA